MKGVRGDDERMARGWAATRLRLRSEVRTTRAGLALLVAVIALSAGVTMAAAAGARRSDSAYGRFLAWSHEPEIGVSGCVCSDAQIGGVFDQVRHAPFVADSVRAGFAEVSPRLPDGTMASVIAFLPVIDLEDRLGRDLPRVKVLHGRLPDPGAPDEVAVGFLTAERFHLHAGDELQLQGLDPDGELYTVEPVRIVGIYAAPGELPSVSGPQGNSFLLTSAFARAFPELVHPANDTLLLRLRPGTTRQEVAKLIDAVGFELDVNEASDLTSGIERTVRVETIAIVLLGVVVGAVGVVVAGQMLRRQVSADPDEELTFYALGSDRGDGRRLGLARGALVGVVGATLGVVVAAALSPLFPVGIGRIADPDVGVHADAVVFGIGAVLTVVLVAALGFLTALRHPWSGRRARDDHPSPHRPLPTTSPPVLAGLCFALPGRSALRRPTLASLVALVTVVVVLGATAVTLASFDHLVDRRDLAGATWQAAFLPPEDADPASSMTLVRSVPGVEAVTSTGWATPTGVRINGQPVATQVFGDGPIRPAVARGRPPTSEGEIAVGPKTMDELGLQLGQRVELSMTPDGPTRSGRVVGEVVLASPYFFDFAPGTGAATTASTFAGLIEPGEDGVGIIMVRYADDADPRRTFTEIEQRLGSVDAFETADRHGVSGLDRVRLVPILLLFGLLALVAAAVTHVLLLSASGHRRDVAVLRALGFTRAQSGASVAVHASLLAVAACAIGLPAGIVAGRAVWNRIAAELYVVPRPMAPVALLALITVTLLVVANTAALVPAVRAARLKPALVLRAD